ncbi:MAG: hypothetical protein K2M67_06610 [Muribaculaceae bacterium]|nr:hypothetical protein [Muribaculaceae bacterium]
MRNILLSAALLLGSFVVGAQGSDPNRLLVVSPDESFKSFMIGRVEAIEFREMENAYTELQLGAINGSTMEVSATMSPTCSSYLLDVMPAVLARQFQSNPAGLFSYLNQSGAGSYNENFSKGTLSGLDDLKSNTEYAVVTASYDQLGTECDVRMAFFTTPKANINGAPSVECKLLNATQSTLTFAFTPNKDVNGYYMVLGDKGTLQEQYEQFAGMFGFANVGDMVKAWGAYVAHDEYEEHTWKDLEPNKEYEVYVLSCDANENDANLQIFYGSTAKMGGSGDAFVNIKVDGYRYANWDNEQKPSLFISYSPNDQTGAYRISVQYATNYDQDPEGYNEDLCQDPPAAMAHWFQYGNITTDYQINPNTEVVIMAAGKNADGKWGKVNTMRYTTPANVSATVNNAEVAPAVVSAGGILGRKLGVKLGNTVGRVPVLKGKVRLEKR